MDTPVPFCEECGRVGATLSGLHPGDGGIARWTLYRCGHVTTAIILDEALGSEDPGLLDEASTA